MNFQQDREAARPDVIFIGAGINSLAAAYLLGKSVLSVFVLERNPEPGGAADMCGASTSPASGTMLANKLLAQSSARLKYAKAHAL